MGTFMATNITQKTKRAPRELFFHFRCTRAEIDVINAHAAQAGMRPGVLRARPRYVRRQAAYREPGR
jgi:hypothetical protein